MAELEHPAVCGGDLGGGKKGGGALGFRGWWSFWLLWEGGRRARAGEGKGKGREGKGKKRTAPNKSFIFPATPPGPGGTCLPGIPVTLIAALFSLPAISTRHSSKKSRSCTAVKASAGSLDAEARCDLACGVVMMGRSEGL